MPVDKCPHCNQIIIKPMTKEEIVSARKIETPKSEQEELVKAVSKIAVKEVLKTIDPLLMKLKELGGDQAVQNKGEANVVAAQNETFEQEVLRLQNVALERLKTRKSQVTKNMNKFKNRVSSRR